MDCKYKPSKERTICGVRGETNPDTVDPNNFAALQIVNKKIFDRYLEKYPNNKNMFYIRNAVDGNEFVPAEELGSNVGWSGDKTKPCKRFNLLSKIYNGKVIIKADHGSNFFVKERTRKDQVEFYQSLFVYIHPSNFGEGMSQTIVEAAACGLPIISCDIGDNRNIMSNEWFIAKEPDEKSIKEINEKIEVLERNKEFAIHVGKENRKRFDEGNWCWSKRAKEFDNLFETVKGK